MRIFLFLFLICVTSYCADWTFVVFMNGDNDLCKSAKKDLSELQYKNVDSTANVIVVFDCNKENDSAIYELHGKWLMLFSRKKDVTSNFTSLEEFDMGDPRFLQEMGEKLFRAYPSKHRMLVVWDHGWGWSKRTTSIQFKGISYDEQSGNYITTKALGEAIHAISDRNYLDIVGFDACLMQMAEVMYEFAPYVDYVIGSEETEPLSGWYYKRLLKSVHDRTMGPVDIGNAILEGYECSTNNKNITLSLVDTKKFLELTAMLKTLVAELDGTDLYEYIRNTPSFKDESYKDLGYFLDQLPNASIDAILNVYKQAVVNHVSNIKSSGISVYLPIDSMNPEYMELKFAQDVEWWRLINER